jgi:hypothetical protein
MRTHHLLCLAAAALLALPLSVTAVEPVPTDLEPPSVAEAVAPATGEVLLEDLFQDASAIDAPAAEEPLFLDGWSCPFYTQICSEDAQCDAVCGGPGLGSCIPFGSPIRKCCACFA